MDKTVGASFETLPITHGLVDVGDDVITTTVMKMKMVVCVLLKIIPFVLKNQTEFVSTTTTTTEQPTTISETTSRSLLFFVFCFTIKYFY